MEPIVVMLSLPCIPWIMPAIMDGSLTKKLQKQKTIPNLSLAPNLAFGGTKDNKILPKSICLGAKSRNYLSYWQVAAADTEKQGGTQRMQRAN